MRESIPASTASTLIISERFLRTTIFNSLALWLLGESRVDEVGDAHDLAEMIVGHLEAEGFVITLKDR